MDLRNNFIAKPDNAFHAFHLAMNPRRLFKFSGFTSAFPRGRQYSSHVPPIGGEEVRNAIYFGSIFFPSNGKLAGTHALVHFPIDAPRVILAGHESVRAAAYLK
jgi:hypothetical protein